MYSWGNTTTNWKKPAGYDYDAARKPYLDKLAADASVKGPRAYSLNQTPNMTLVDPKGKIITSTSQNPIVIGIDVTGSMMKAPGEFFDRAPLIWQTLSQYRPDLEICFAAIGDVNTDQWPLQVNDFGKELSLEDHIKAIGCEGNGGGQGMESYELFGYFMLEHCKLPNATMPFLIIYGDEKFYDAVSPSQVEHVIGDKLSAPIASSAVWKKLQQKFNVYFVQKKYGHETSPDIDAEVRGQWASVLGDERIVASEGMDRAADQVMGIIAKNWGQYGDFKKNMGARQDDGTIHKIDQSLRYIGGKPTLNSVRPKAASGKKTKPLDKSD